MGEQATVEAALVLRPARPQDAAACAAIFDAWVDATDWIPRLHPPAAVERHFRETVLAVAAGIHVVWYGLAAFAPATSAVPTRCRRASAAR